MLGELPISRPFSLTKRQPKSNQRSLGQWCNYLIVVLRDPHGQGLTFSQVLGQEDVHAGT